MREALHRIEAWVLTALMISCLAACSAGGDGGPSPGGPGASAAWARSVASAPTASEFDGVATDGAGNVYVAGAVWGPGSFDFGSGVTVTTVSDGWDALVIRYDASGTPSWVRTVAAGPIRSEFSAVVVDSSGAVYACGFIYGASGSVDFGNGVTLTKSDAFRNAVLVKYDAAGLAEWAQVVAGDGGDSFCAGLTVDAAGGVYAVGAVDGTGTYDFGNDVRVTGVTTGDGFINPPDTAVLVKYDASGVAQWARAALGGSPSSGFSSVAVDAAGDVYTAGHIAGTNPYDFGDGVTVVGTAHDSHIAGEASSSALLVKYDPTGVAHWARSIDGHGASSGFDAVALDSAGAVYVAGSTGACSPCDFGGGVTAAGSVKDGSFTGLAGPQFVVLAKYDASGAAQWARTVSPGGSNSYFTSVATDGSDNVYVAGAVDPTGTYVFGDGASIVTSDHRRGSYPAVVKYDASGSAQWARSSSNGDSSTDILYSVTLDPSGNIYAAGVIAGPGEVDFDGQVSVVAGAATTPDGWSGLVVKYRP